MPQPLRTHLRRRTHSIASPIPSNWPAAHSSSPPSSSHGCAFEARSWPHPPSALNGGRRRHFGPLRPSFSSISWEDKAQSFFAVDQALVEKEKEKKLPFIKIQEVRGEDEAKMNRDEEVIEEKERFNELERWNGPFIGLLGNLERDGWPRGPMGQRRVAYLRVPTFFFWTFRCLVAATNWARWWFIIIERKNLRDGRLGGAPFFKECRDRRNFFIFIFMRIVTCWTDGFQLFFWI